jgi:uncharacterized protein with PIN domain
LDGLFGENGLKFITDGMLGKITRWLRMIGGDVFYTSSMDDRELIQKAKKENQVLLTQDRELYQQAIGKGAEAFLVKGVTNAEKLASLSKRFKFKLQIDAKVSRCPKCNARIKSVTKADVMNKIPKATSHHYNDFWQCPKCGKIYWHGAHWKRIEQTLTEARKSFDLFSDVEE